MSYLYERVSAARARMSRATHMCPLCVYASCVYMPTSYERVSVARARVRRAIHMCPPCVYVSSLHERVMSRV